MGGSRGGSSDPHHQHSNSRLSHKRLAALATPLAWTGAMEATTTIDDRLDDNHNHVYSTNNDDNDVYSTEDDDDDNNYDKDNDKEKDHHPRLQPNPNPKSRRQI